MNISDMVRFDLNGYIPLCLGLTSINILTAMIRFDLDGCIDRYVQM